MEEQTIIINDLLSFLWCKGDVVPREMLLKCAKSFYSHQFASDALNSLLTALSVDIKRKQLNLNPFVAILDVLETLPKDQIPTLVCRNLNNVPDLDSRCRESSDDLFNDDEIYTEHKRLVADVKSLNKSLSDLSTRLHRFSDKQNDANNDSVSGSGDLENRHDEGANERKELKEESCTQIDELIQTNEEIGMGLIANRYQRALARRVEKGKDLKVRKIRPLLFESLEKNGSRSLEGQIISSSPFYKIDTVMNPRNTGNISSQTVIQELDSQDEMPEALYINEDYKDDEDDSESNENDGEELPEEDADDIPIKTNSSSRSTSAINEPGIGTSFRCPYCGADFRSRDWLLHVKNCHGVDGAVNPEDFYCAKCDIYFASKKVLGFHMGFHDNARPFECQECHYRFYTQKSVKSHTKMHFVDFRHKCPFCYFQAYKLSRVKEHIRSHTGEKPYKCPMCDYATSSYTTLVRGHMHAHSDLRAFKCEQCDRCYKTKSKLQLHMRCHSTEKIYKCSVCGMGFNKSYRLTIHFKGHLTEKTYGCSRCDFITKRTTELRRHMKKHQ